MTTDIIATKYLNEYQRLTNLLPGRDLHWLAETRTQAINHFMRQGLPSTKHEDWKYTRLTALTKQNFKICEQQRCAITSLDKLNINLPSIAGYLIVFVDGHYQAHLSKLDNLPETCIITNLQLAIYSQATLIQQYLNHAIDSNTNGFTQLNTALMLDGAFIYLPAKTILAKPIYILQITTKPDNLSHIRNLIITEKNSKATIIEHFCAVDSLQYFNNSISEIFVAADAQIEHFKLQQESEQAFHIGTTFVKQERSSQYINHSLALGGALVRSDTKVLFNEQFAECELYGLYMLHNQQHIDHHTVIEHQKANCKSNEYYKGIINHQAHGVFNGKIIVAPNAQGTDTQQTNKNLLLSKLAEIDTKPQLEIYANDVKCTHGATVGQLDTQALFYLRSRGISETDAKILLIQAFAEDVIDKIDLEPIRDWTRKNIAIHLPKFTNEKLS